MFYFNLGGIIRCALGLGKEDLVLFLDCAWKLSFGFEPIFESGPFINSKLISVVYFANTCHWAARKTKAEQLIQEMLLTDHLCVRHMQQKGSC